MGTAGRGVTLTTHPDLMPRSRMKSYTSSPSKRHHGVYQDCFDFLTPSGNYMYHLPYQSVTLHFVFVGFV
jgi:hypothetical protein